MGMSIIKLAEGELLVNDIPAHEALADVEVTNRFVKLAESIKKLAPRSEDFLYFTAIMMHGAEAALIDPKTGETKKDKGGNTITGGFDDNWKWSCSDPSIDPYSNQNGDIFPSIELKKAYSKWRGRPLCINHQSSDVEGVRGIIIDTHWDEKYKRVVALCALDKKSYPDLAHKVKTGYANCVSMGTAVGRALCTVCQKSAVTERDYCDCIRSRKGQRINGIRVGEVNLDLNPIELSLVVTPADQQAKVLKIIASMNNYVDQRKSLLEEKEQVGVEKLAQLDDSIKSVQTQLNRLFAECTDVACQFVRGEDGHIKLVKKAQDVSWEAFFDTARDIDFANDYDKRELFDKLNQMRPMLKTEDLRSNPELLMNLADVMSSKNKYLHEAFLQPIMGEVKAMTPPPMQENQFTTPNGPDKDLGLDSGAEVTMPANEQETGARMSKVVNPSEQGIKPDKGGDVGQEMGSASDRFQFGNYASNKDISVLMAKGGKKTADIEENLNLLLKQTQDIEKEMNAMKEKLNTNNTSAVAVEPKAAAVEDLKMNEARLKLRAAQRQALLAKQAEKEMCEECKEVECKCEEDKKEKKAYWLGTTEPTPGKPQYKSENGGEPKIRMNDKQMHQDKSMGGADKSVPGDEAEKKKLLRAELEERALQRRAYWLGTTEPKPGQTMYKPENGGETKIRMDDKQMHQDKAMGGDKGSFPGDEAEKKKLLRAELVPGVLRTKFTMLRNADGTYNKQGSYLEVFAGENKLLKATAEEIYAEDLDKVVPNRDGTPSGKTGWEVLQTPEYGKEVMAAIREKGFEKVAEMLKGAQAAPMPEMPPALEAPAAGAAESPEMKNVNVNEVMSLLGEAEEKLDQMRTAVTGESEGEVKDMSVETGDADKGAAEAAGAELTASLVSLSREVYAELDRSADELALIVEYFNKAASLSTEKKEELNKIATDAVADGKALLEEADTILAVAGKVPAGLKAFQEKQKAKKKGDDKDKDEKKSDKKDKKEDKAEKKDKKEDKKEKKDDKKKDKKKSKKAELVEMLLKIAQEESDEEEIVATAEKDDLDAEMDELGLLPKNDAADEEMCGMCGLAMDKEHMCTASVKNELVREALAARKLKREALLKAAEDKKYEVTPDTHGLQGEAHKGSEANPATQLDNKPAGDGAVIEGIDKIHDAMVDAAEAAPTGKVGGAVVDVKEAEIKAALESDLKAKKAEEDKTKFRVKLRRAYDLGLQMQEKGMVSRTKEALDMQVDEIMKFDDQAFESYKRVVANTNAVKTASVKNIPQPGVREDNSQPDDGAVAGTLADQLSGLWK